jgi:nitrite reductase/ring-hydroxylating ferredoxin subunit
MSDSGNAPTFVATASADVLARDGTYACLAGTKQVLLCRHQGQWYALAPLCTHAGVPLEGARMAHGKIYCPLHGAAFDLATGVPLSPPAFHKLETFPVRISDGQIEVAI